MKVKILRMCDDAIIPNKAHNGDACYDLYSIDKDFEIASNERVLISTGIKIQLPMGYEAVVRSRSGNAFKRGLFVLNSPATIDSRYRGEIKVILYNSDKQSHIIKKGDRIAQIGFRKVPDFKIVEVDEIDKTERGEQGFGSTGI